MWRRLAYLKRIRGLESKSEEVDDCLTAVLDTVPVWRRLAVLELFHSHSAVSCLIPNLEWAKYFGDKERDTLLNVISLEFSKTPMDEHIASPAVVRCADQGPA